VSADRVGTTFAALFHAAAGALLLTDPLYGSCSVSTVLAELLETLKS